MQTYATKTFDISDPQTPAAIDAWLNGFGGDIGSHRANICGYGVAGSSLIMTVQYFDVAKFQEAKAEAERIAAEEVTP